ncbi:MAG: hypothetical protein AAF495_01880 [Pseudomonadota bacterium]
MTEETVDTQVIANLVVRDPEGRVLFVRYDPENEKWWLPGKDVAPYTHPDETAAAVLAAVEGLAVDSTELSHVESFRGRRGWHLVFNYDVRATGAPGGSDEAQWFDAEALPRTVHGAWEKQVVARVTAGQAGRDHSAA